MSGFHWGTVLQTILGTSPGWILVIAGQVIQWRKTRSHVERTVRTITSQQTAALQASTDKQTAALTQIAADEAKTVAEETAQPAEGVSPE